MKEKIMRKTAQLKKHQVNASASVSTSSSESERALRLARVDAYFKATREQFAKQVASANAGASSAQVGVLAGPIERRR
jgi:hypothetical protein